MTVNNNANAAAQQEAARRRIAEENARRQREAQAKQAAENAAKPKPAKTTPKLAADRDGTTGPIGEKGSKLDLDPGKAAPLPADLTLDQIKADPKLAARVAQASANGSDADKAKIDALLRGAVKDAALAGAQAGKNVSDVVNQDLVGLAQATGLGASLQRVAQGGLEDAAKELLGKNLSAGDVTKPGNASLLAVLQNSSDQGAKDQLKSLVQKAANDSLTRNLDGKQKEDGVKQALEGYQNDMKALAEAGLGVMVQDVAKSVVDSRKGDLENTANKGKHWWNKIGDFFGKIGDFVGGVFNKIGDFCSKGFDFVATGLEKGIQGLGKVVTAPTKLLGKGLSAIGLDGAGKFVSGIGDKVDGAITWAGKQVGGFTRGVGDALKGTIQGVGQIVGHPLETAKALGGLILHPSRIADVGKAFWAEAKKGGWAHAVGYIAGNVAPMLLSGGAAAGADGAKVSLLAKGAEKLGDLGLTRTASVATKVAEGGERALNVARAIKGFDPKRALMAFDKPVLDDAGNILKTTVKDFERNADGKLVRTEVSRTDREGNLIRDRRGNEVKVQKLEKIDKEVDLTQGLKAYNRLPKVVRGTLDYVADNNVNGVIRSVFTKQEGRLAVEGQVLGYGKIVNKYRIANTLDRGLTAALDKLSASDFALESVRTGVNAVNVVTQADQARQDAAKRAQ